MIEYIENIDSTHLHVIKALKEGKINPPYLLYAGSQYGGVGSRGNHWEGALGNLYMSLCVEKKHIASDVPAPSMSIYFAQILKEIFTSHGSQVWLKWPNDFYLGEKKIGGIITAKIGDFYIGSTGINIASAPEEFGILDIKMTNTEIVEEYYEQIKKIPSWKQIFSKFRVEFQKSKKFSFHDEGKSVSLAEATLNDDGSIQINNKKVYNLR